MPSLSILKVLLREAFTRTESPRVPEPDLVMDDPERVAAFNRAGEEGGVMAAVYLFHCAQVCEVIRPGDTVLDLGCGPANQLAMIARLNPDVRFVGIDLSEPMLQRARELTTAQQLTNVSFHQGSITDLSEFASSSVDAVMSTVVLHHLPDQAALQKTFSEAARVLKKGGGVYMVDFGHLCSEDSIHYFAHQHADRQPELFTEDYWHSLRAAFYLKDLRQAARPLLNHAQLYTTWLMPFMVAIKSAPRRGNDPVLSAQLVAMGKELPPYYQTDFADLSTFFRLGGLSSALLR